MPQPDHTPESTEAVAFDPFADDTESTEHTQAVAFDPFADDTDDATESAYVPDLSNDLANADLYGDDVVSLLKDLDKLKGTTKHADKQGGEAGLHGSTGVQQQRENTSQRSRREAISTFRERRGTQRAARTVADGMVELPWIPPFDPSAALIDPASATEEKGIPEPQLSPGDVVAEQYEIKGVIAHGGMGWIYLATDRNVAGRVVVLKGLHAEKSRDEASAAAAEREFLADITHPEIVKIFNFIDDPRVPGGFIVMEFVGGPSLRQRRNDQPNHLLPIDLAIGYMLEILPALSYLHSRGVVYNDLKPDNIIVTEDQVKLIDLGAVSGIGAFGFIYGTRGFQAPEVASEGPSIASDIYTIGRTLLALTINMPRDDNGIYVLDLPGPSDEPTFRRYLSYYRLLARCCHPDPKKRFASVEELQRQMLGVLREVIALRDGRYFPARHSLFSPQRTTFGTKHIVFRTDQLIDGIERTVEITATEVVSALPTPLIDRSDVGAGLISGSSYAEPHETLEMLRQAMSTPEYETSAEIPFAVVRAMLDLGLTSQARHWLVNLPDRMRGNWRFHWYHGVTSLMRGDFTTAQADFSQVLDVVPGESAPKLALAAVDELLLQEQGMQTKEILSDYLAQHAAGLDCSLAELPNEFFQENTTFTHDWSTITDNPATLRVNAMRLYSLVWLTNSTTVSSAFGLARQLMFEGEVEMAVDALDRVPQQSRHQRMAKLTTILDLISEPATSTRSFIPRDTPHSHHTPQQHTAQEDTAQQHTAQQHTAAFHEHTDSVHPHSRGANPPAPGTLHTTAAHPLIVEERIRRAARRLEEIPTNEPRLLQIKVAVLRAALEYLRDTGQKETENKAPLFDYPFTQQGLRTGLAITLREQARRAPTARHRHALVDTANKVRPSTWF